MMMYKKYTFNLLLALFSFGLGMVVSHKQITRSYSYSEDLATYPIGYFGNVSLRFDTTNKSTELFSVILDIDNKREFVFTLQYNGNVEGISSRIDGKNNGISSHYDRNGDLSAVYYFINDELVWTSVTCMKTDDSTFAARRFYLPVSGQNIFYSNYSKIPTGSFDELQANGSLDLFVSLFNSDTTLHSLFTANKKRALDSLKIDIQEVKWLLQKYPHPASNIGD